MRPREERILFLPESRSAFHFRIMSKLGLFLSGGGSRAAYQVGVLKALHEINPRVRFPVIVGFSAGAINASYLATQADRCYRAVLSLERMWSQTYFHNVFRTDVGFFFGRALKIFWDLLFGGLHRSTSLDSLLDATPLREFLEPQIPFQRIQRHLQSGDLQAFAVCATDYDNGDAVNFYQDRNGTEPWVRRKRRAQPVKFKLDHILASAAIPMLFPSIPVEGSYYGDGSIRNTAPLSPVIHLGADAIVIIGVRKQKDGAESAGLKKRPSIGKILGTVLNALILDHSDGDVERLSRINQTVELIPTSEKQRLHLRKIPYLWITPSEDIGAMAKDHVKIMPAVLRYVLRGLGKKEEFSEVASYLLFHPSFTGRLIELGYRDTLNMRDRVEEFYSQVGV